MRWYKSTDPIEPNESKQILFYAGGCSLPYLGFYYKNKNMFGDWKAEDVQKWQYMEEILNLANQVPEKRYTFSTLNSGTKVYPLKNVGPGLIDYDWTDKKEEAITWSEQDMVETIAIEFYNTEIIEINESGEYKVIKTME